MKRKCDKCDRVATNHSIVIVNNAQKIEKHLCDLHAAEEGMPIKMPHTPGTAAVPEAGSAHELLTSFIKLEDPSPSEVKSPKTCCQTCGLSFAQFRESSLLGCPDCYVSFERVMGSLLERAHEGGTHHVGKVPRRAGASQERQNQLQRLRKRLDEAVLGEDYELAAQLRDDIHRTEGQT